MAAQRYTRIEVIGEGTYGRVYRARNNATGEVVAIKRLFPAQEEEGVSATTIREIAILKHLQHPNIVQLKDVLFEVPKLTLVFEICESDLKQYMVKHGRLLDMDSVRSFTYQLLCGLACLHEIGIVHRDLKPQNLLINEGTKALKICDFGLARVEGIPVKKYSHEAVTLWYRPPDVILGSANYGLSVDLWSAGCIFGELLSGSALFQGRTDGEQLLRMFQLLGRPENRHLARYPDFFKFQNSACITDTLDPPAFERWINETPVVSRGGTDGVDLLKRMLTINPRDRITAAEALRHPFFLPLAPSAPTPQQIAAVLGSPMSPRTSPRDSPAAAPTNIVDVAHQPTQPTPTVPKRSEIAVTCPVNTS